MHEAASLVVGASLIAAERIVSVSPIGRSASRVGCITPCGTTAAGFCVYNDCSAAIRHLLDSGVERVAYIDVDVHHGDGVQAAFYDDPRVLTISLHQHPTTLWPRHRLRA